MKTNKKNFPVIYMIIIIISAFVKCQEDWKSVKIYGDLCFQIEDNSLLKNTSSPYCDFDDAKKIILTITNSDGSETKFLSSELGLYKMNSNYFSQKIALEVGSYLLTEFLLIDKDNNVIYAAPYEGSLQAQNVNSPLPISFSIIKDSINEVNVEVLSTEGLAPEDFGLSSFIIKEIKTFSFLINVSEMGHYRLLTAELTVSSGDYLYKQKLDTSMTNKVTIRDNLSPYTLTVRKAGYKTYNGNFTADELKEYKDNPVVIELEPLDGKPDEGLVVYYSFDGNANDNNGTGYDGIVYGASLVEDRHENPDKAYYFDGVNDYIEVTGFGSIVPANEISISLWARTEASKAQFAMLLCPENSGTSIQNTLDVCINYYHGLSNWIFWDFGWRGEGGNVPGRLYVEDVPFDTDWHHYVFISSSSQEIMKLYKDGILLNVENDPMYLFDSGEKYLRIGSGEDQRYFKGAIDEIYMYNRVLSEVEIEILLSN